MTLRGLVKTAAAETLDRTGAARAARALRARSSGAVVLGYHRVVEDAARRASIPAMVVSTRTLERQLDCVGRDHLFVSLDELAERLESGRPADRPLAAVTFDDGYRDVYEHALPLLRRKGIPAAVFVVTGLVGTARLQRHDRLYLALARLLARGDGEARLARIAAGLGPRSPGFAAGATAGGPGVFATARAFIENFAAPDLERALRAIESEAGPTPADHPELRSLTWDMVLEMHAAGITVGSHTASHVLLTHEDRDTVRAELRASREALEEKLGAPVRHFAYPDGSFDTAAVDEVAAAGYRYAYTTCGHRDRRHPNLTVPRRVLWENSSRGAGGRFSAAVMRCGVHGVFDVVGGCRRDHGRSARAGRAASA